MTAVLPPVRQPVGIFGQFMARQSETMVIQERFLSLDYCINLVNDTPLFQVDSRLFSLCGRKLILDMEGRHLFSIIKEHFHLHDTYTILSPDDRKIMEVKNTFAIFGSKAYGTFISRNGKEEKLTMKGDFFESYADITDESQGNVIVARIDRKIFSSGDILLGQRKYALTVAPGVDMALMAALCICLNEKTNN